MTASLIFLTLLATMAPAAADLPSALVEPYLQAQTALSADSLEGVAAHAQAIEKAAATLGPEAQQLVAGAKALAAASDLKTARAAFGDVSVALVAYAEKTKSGFGAGIRQAFCPMVNKPWLTRDKTIRNPYYGASMLTCGSFKG